MIALAAMRQTPHRVAERLARGASASGGLILALDYDGTLVPIRPRPELARADGETRSILAALASRRGCIVAVVSGRTVTDLCSVLDPPGALYLFGEHGGVGRDPDGHGFVLGSRAGTRHLEAVRERLRSIDWPRGAWLEEKRTALALHTRGCTDENAVRGVWLFREAVRAADPGASLRILEGRRLVEVRLRGIHKGLVVDWLRRQAGPPGALLCYAGDDATDEDAFEALRAEDLGIKVGDMGPETAASHRLREPGELRAVLTELLLQIPAPGEVGR